MTRVLRTAILPILISMSQLPGEALAANRRDVSLYGGVSLYPEDTFGHRSSFGARLAVVMDNRPEVARVGGEVGYLGLGSEGFGSEAFGGANGGGTIHYGLVHAGPIVRLQTTGKQRAQAYAVLGAGPYAHRSPDAPDPFRPGHTLRFGGSAGAGVYGLAPGMLGLELRWHVIAEGRRSPAGPLSLVSVMAGFNF